MPDYNKGDFTQQGVAGHVNAILRLNEKRLVNIDMTSNEEAEGCTITGAVTDLLNDKVYPIGSAPSGNIEITENGENINVAPYATATVNVAGGGGGITPYYVSGTLKNTTSTPCTFYIPACLTQEVEGVSFSVISLSSGTVSNEDDPIEFVTLIPEADNMSLYLIVTLYGSQEITVSNEVNCTVLVDGEDVNVLITDDNASFDLTITQP